MSGTPKRKKTAPKKAEPVIAYKGFDKDLKCRGFQYEVGKTYKHEGEVEPCESGFHACLSPFDVWTYYPPVSRFAEVVLSGETNGRDDGSKIAAAEITINAELTLPEFIKRGVDFILAKAKDTAKETGNRSAATNTGDWSAATNTGYRSAATNTGYRSAATNTGNQSAATNTGYRSAATNTGDWSAATNTGDWSAATNTGDYSAATNTGDWSAATNTGYQSAATNTGYQSAATNTGNYSAATNTGDYSAATNTGNQSAATNTGYQSAASVEGKNAIAVASGIGGRAKAAAGSAIVLCEYDKYLNLTAVHSAIAGKGGVKPDTWYTAKGGTLVEVEE